MRKMTGIGAQVSSLKPYLQSEPELRTAFGRLAKMGYRDVQLQWIAPEIEPEIIADALAEAGLFGVSTQDYYEVVRKRLGYFLKLNDLCGSRHVCVSGIPSEYLSYEGCREFGKELAELTRQLEAEGKILSFHPRSQEFAVFGGRTAVEILLEEAPEPFSICLDLYHVEKAGLSMGDWVRKLRDRVDMVHFKDYIKRGDGTVALAPVGQGCIDWSDAVAACREISVPWAFAEQETWEKDAFVCMEESREWLERNFRRGISVTNKYI